MNGLIFTAFIYISFLCFWGVVNVVVFAFSYLRKINYLKGLDLLNNIVLYIIQIAIWISGIRIVWFLFTTQEWLLLFLAFMFGGFLLSIYTTFYLLLQMPFRIITKYLSDVVEKSKNDVWSEYDAEIISPEGEVIDSYSSDDKLNKRIWIWFLINYFLFIFGYLTDGEPRNWGWGDYVVMPIIGMIIFLIPIIIISLLWNLIKKRKLMPNGRIELIANAIRAMGIILITLLLLTNLVF